MISGPVCPQNREGLRELIDRHLEEVERGLLVVESDLELEGGCRIDGLAVDAAGRPVLLFVAHDDDLAARILAARAWIASAGLSLLGRFLAHPGLDWALPARFVVLGFDLGRSLLGQLADLRHLRVEAYLVRSLRVGGRLLMGAVPIPLSEEPRGAPGPEPTHAAEPPGAAAAGADASPLGRWGEQLLDLIERLDPAIESEGVPDRRRLAVLGYLLAEVCAQDGVTTVYLPVGAGVNGNGAEAPPPIGFELRSDADCRDVADRVLGRYLDIVRARRSKSTEPIRQGHAAPLERLWQTVSEARLSPEEYSVLGESGTIDD